MLDTLAVRGASSAHRELPCGRDASREGTWHLLSGPLWVCASASCTLHHLVVARRVSGL